MHPWHDVAIDPDRVADEFPAVIEIPRASRNKYELDKATGMLRLDRVLYGAVHYPADYGFVPRTLCDDGDALDVLVLCQEPVAPLTIVDARPIGMIRMSDEMGLDDKLIAVSLGDPGFRDLRHHRELSRHVLAQLRKFFEEYKTLEGKRVDVGTLEGPEAAVAVLRRALLDYDAKYPR